MALTTNDKKYICLIALLIAAAVFNIFFVYHYLWLSEPKQLPGDMFFVGNYLVLSYCTPLHQVLHEVSSSGTEYIVVTSEEVHHYIRLTLDNSGGQDYQRMLTKNIDELVNVLVNDSSTCCVGGKLFPAAVLSPSVYKVNLTNFTLTMERVAYDTHMDNGKETCQKGDLISPDLFVTTPDKYQQMFLNLTFPASCTSVGRGLGLAIFLSDATRGCAAYCPNTDFTDLIDVTPPCRHLPTAWDSKLVDFALFTGIHRLIIPDSIDGTYWLTCVWSSTSYELNLPNACSRFTEQMTADVTDMLGREGVRYRLIFGSAIGALRHNGTVPWTVDVDIGLTLDDYKMFYEWMPRIVAKNSFIFSVLNRRGLRDLDLARLFLSCPIPEAQISNPWQLWDSNLISNVSSEISNTNTLRVKKCSPENNDRWWRCMGTPYVDFYYPSKTRGFIYSMHGTGKIINVGKAWNVRIPANTKEHLKKVYGKQWNVIPKKMESPWDWYQD